VAPADLVFGLGRMYETYRGLNERSTKEVAVFRTRPEALDWLAEARGTPKAEGTGFPAKDRAS